MLATFSGWKGETEIVQLEYDPRIISYSQLCERAHELGACSIAFPAGEEELVAAREVFGENARSSDAAVRRVDDTKYYLLEDPVRFVPMTQRQATRLNAMDPPRDYASILSPRQLEQLERVRATDGAGFESALDLDIFDATATFERSLARQMR